MPSMMMWKRAQEQGDLSDTDSEQYGPNYGGDDDGYNSWWWSPAGMAVRYTIVIILFTSLLVYLLGGYVHARRRMRNGLPPLRYHAWMVRRAYRQPQNYYQHQQTPYPMNGYQQNAYHNPPPAYNPYNAPPPAYQPPEGASKVLADQQGYAQAQRAETQGESSTVPPPPPAARH